MASPMFVRFSNFRNLLRINNNVLGVSSNPTQCLESIFRLSSTNQYLTLTEDTEMTNLSKAMQGYLKRIRANEELMKKEIQAYEKGKRHLANMMGEDPEHFTQEDIDRSIEYLFPSALYEPKARPMMKHPKDLFLSQKTGQFFTDGKPCHPFFYTLYPLYYETLHTITEKLQNLDDLEDKFIKSTGTLPNESKLDVYGSIWISKNQLGELLQEKLTDYHYEYFIKTMEKLLNHPLSQKEKDFIMKYRNKLSVNINKQSILPILYNEDGKPYVKIFPCQRKSAIATVTVWGKGTGKITINGKDISYFHDMQSRQQIIFPLIFTDMIDKVDIEATVENGGPTGQSGAIRWGIAWCLRSFVTPEVVENMKIGNGWKVIEGSEEGQTQESCDIYTNEPIWDHPVDIHYTTQTLHNSPKLLLQIFSRDNYGRVLFNSYGVCNIPLSPGSHCLNCYTWKPIGDWKDRLRDKFLGVVLQLKSPNVLVNTVDRFELLTESMGTVQIDLHILVRNFDKFGCHL